jgi:hypothetical protein
MFAERAGTAANRRPQHRARRVYKTVGVARLAMGGFVHEVVEPTVKNS